MTKTLNAKSTTRKYEVIRKQGGVAGRMRAADAIAYVQQHGGSIYSTSTSAARGGRMATRMDNTDANGTVSILDYFKGKGYVHIVLEQA